MKTIHSISELKSLTGAEEIVFVRWSRGPEADAAMGGRSTDYVTGETHSGLSSVPVQPHQVSDERISRALTEYRFLRMKDAELFPWIARAPWTGSRDSDGGTLIDADEMEVIGRLSDELIAQLVAYNDAWLDYDRQYRRLPMTKRMNLQAPVLR